LARPQTTGFFDLFMGIFRDSAKRDDPESYLDFESSLKKHIDTHPQRTADTKAKAAQYFTILNRIEYVIEIDAKYSEPRFLFFWRKFNTLYNMMHRSEDVKDPIEVYFDNQIGIVEIVPEESKEKKKKPTKVAKGKPPGPGGKFDILAIIAARNEQEAKTGALIEDFENKISDFFSYVRSTSEGERLIVKIRSHVSEEEIYDDFSKIYRRYKALNRQTVGDYFFRETEDLVDKLCDDFEMTVREKHSDSKSELPIAHRIDDRELYFYDEMVNNPNTIPLATFKVTTDIPYIEDLESITVYECSGGLYNRGIIGREVLDGYFSIIDELQGILENYELTRYDANNKDKLGLIWSLIKATQGSSIIEFALSAFGYSVAIGTPVMAFLAAYPKASDGFERLKQDLKKRFKSQSKDKTYSAILLDTCRVSCFMRMAFPVS
jgi:hypothetical protein